MRTGVEEKVRNRWRNRDVRETEERKRSKMEVRMKEGFRGDGERSGRKASKSDV